MQQLLDRLGAKSIGRVEQDQVKGTARHAPARSARQHVTRHHTPTRTVTAERLDILGNQTSSVAIDLERGERAGATREHLNAQGAGAAKGIQHADLVQIEVECRHDHRCARLAHAIGRGAGDIATTGLLDLTTAPFAADDSHPPLTSLKMCRYRMATASRRGRVATESRLQAYRKSSTASKWAHSINSSSASRSTKRKVTPPCWR